MRPEHATQCSSTLLSALATGSTAAALLAKAGRNVALVEKAEFPRRKVCGEYISAATLPLLDACGVGEAFRRDAGPAVSRVAFYAGQTLADAPLPAGGSRALGRDTLDTVLLEAAVAAGATAFTPPDFRTPEGAPRTATSSATSPRGGGGVTALHRIADGYRANIAGEYEIEAPIVIAACGSWNTKGPFALDPAPRDFDMLAFKSHFRNANLPAGLMPLLAFAGGYGGMVESDGGRTSLSCCIRRNVLTAARDRLWHARRRFCVRAYHGIDTRRGTRPGRRRDGRRGLGRRPHSARHPYALFRWRLLHW